MDRNTKIFTNSPDDTKKAGKEFASTLKGGEVVSLVGDLGAGKTIFVQGLASGLGIQENIVSPTFILMRQYKLNSILKTLNSSFLYHVDLYRFEENIEDEIRKIGITNLWGKPESIFVIEWADKACEFLPNNTIWVNIQKKGEDERVINIER